MKTNTEPDAPPIAGCTRREPDHTIRLFNSNLIIYTPGSLFSHTMVTVHRDTSSSRKATSQNRSQQWSLYDVTKQYAVTKGPAKKDLARTKASMTSQSKSVITKGLVQQIEMTDTKLKETRKMKLIS